MVKRQRLEIVWKILQKCVVGKEMLKRQYYHNIEKNIGYHSARFLYTYENLEQY